MNRQQAELIERASQLADNWLNGNREGVLTSLAECTPARAAALAVLVFECLRRQYRPHWCGTCDEGRTFHEHFQKALLSAIVD